MGLYLKDMELPNAIQGVRTVNIYANGEVTNYAGEVIATAVSVPLYEVQVRHGEWVEENRRPKSCIFYCSECKRTCYDIQPSRNAHWKKRCRYAYCPNCGARMDGRTEDGDGE